MLIIKKSDCYYTDLFDYFAIPEDSLVAISGFCSKYDMIAVVLTLSKKRMLQIFVTSAIIYYQKLNKLLLL